MTESTATIADRGYQHYTGVRLGLLHALQTMAWASIKRAMGIRRPFRAKIMPWLLFAATYAPVFFVVAVRVAGTPSASLLPSAQLYSGYFALIVPALILFAGLSGPELLCPDRRERVLSLYFVAPITRMHYAGARLAGLVALMLAMTVVPALCLFLAGALLTSNTISFLGHHAGEIPRIVVSGALVALYYSAVAMGVAAFNDRRAYAGGIFVGMLLVSSIAAGIISAGMHFSRHQWFDLLNLATLPIQAEFWIFGQKVIPDIGGWPYLVAALVAIVISLGLLSWEYERIGE